MKRFFAVFFIILLVSAMTVSAMASEHYDFYHKDVMFLPDFDLTSSGEWYEFYGYLSPGLYEIQLVFPNITFELGQHDILYWFKDDADLYIWESSVVFAHPNGFDMLLELTVASFVDEGGYTGLMVESEDNVHEQFPEAYFRFIPAFSLTTPHIVTSYDFVPVVNSFESQFSLSSAVDLAIVAVSVSVGLAFMWWGVRKVSGALMAAFRKGKLRI